MAVLAWDEAGKKLYETGVKKGVLYVASGTAYPKGVAWNGLSGVTESPSGAEATAIYADDSKYLNLYSAEEFKATIEAYTYPDEFAECDGSVNFENGMCIGQQLRKTFGICYRTIIGNDIDNNNYGYKLHLVYGLMASPSERAFSTTNDSPEAISFSWECNSTPVADPNFKDSEGKASFNPISVITIDSTKATSAGLAALEAALYGTDSKEAYLPLPSEVQTLLNTVG